MIPLLLDICPETVESLVHRVAGEAVAAGYAKTGETAVLVFGSRKDGPSELLKIHQL